MFNDVWYYRLYESEVVWMAYEEENEAEGSKELRGGGIRVLFPIFPFREELISYVK